MYMYIGRQYLLFTAGIKRKNLTELLSGRIKEGMFYMGESAGAMIMSKDIAYGQIMDDKNVAQN